MLAQTHAIPPPKKREPDPRQTGSGLREKHGQHEYTLVAFAQKGLVDAMCNAQARGAHAEARECWDRLRLTVLNRSPAEVAEMERRRGLI